MSTIFWTKGKLVAVVTAAVVVAAAVAVPLTIRAMKSNGETRPEPRPTASPVPATVAPALPVAVDVPAEDIAAVVEGNNAFAFAFYTRLREDRANAGKNIFFSPYSISTALAMTYGGARGRTATQMARALRFSLPQARLHPAMGALIRDLNAPERKEHYELAVANRLYGQQGYRFLPEFLKLTERSYGAPLEQVGFPEPGRRMINAWVEEQTKEKIKNLIPKREMLAGAVLVLTNAIYFKGDWASQFKKAETRDAPFKLAGGKEVTVPLMRQTAEFGYDEHAELQVLELPYVGEELSMVILLPVSARVMARMERSLDAEQLAGWLGRLHKQKVQVYLPRFKLAPPTINLVEKFRELGMTDAFGGGADFSGMDGEGGLSISLILHKAYVDVNEEGTEAAAATAVVMTKGNGGGPPVFRADRPFIFLIRDVKSGAILFMGRVMNPAAEK